MEERRRYFRWQVDKQALMNLEGEPSYAICQVNDINYKGLQISSERKLPEASFLKLNVAFPDELTLNTEVWVAWHKSTEASNLYGLFFTRIKDPDKEKIYNFVYKYNRGQITKKWWEGMGGDDKA